MTPEERYAEIKAHVYDLPWLLKFLDEHQPLTAQLLRQGEDSLSQEQRDALRYGLVQVSNSTCDHGHGLNRDCDDCDVPHFAISYPASEET